MIKTPRLILRPYHDSDRDALHAMWADPIVMANLGPVKDSAASDAMINRHRSYYENSGLGFRTVLTRDSVVLGLCGLKPGAPNTPIENETEISWILARSAWGRGFAKEAATATLYWAWEFLRVDRVSAITGRNNLASRRLMERLGMEHVPKADFWHPNYALTDSRGDTVVYRVSADVWKGRVRDEFEFSASR